MSTVVGIDVGGTFTDLYMRDAGGAETIVKVPSTPGDPSRAVLDALMAGGVDGLDVLVHGTTMATNAIIERRGAPSALITTRGFRDVLELGRRDRPAVYGLGGLQRPLIARPHRWEVDERIDARGRVLTALDEPGVRALAEELRLEGLESVAVVLLHAYANPAHELAVRRILEEVEPGWSVVLSHEVVAEYYEFERTSTTVVEAYLRPLVRAYARRLTARLDKHRMRPPTTLLMQSNGGVVPVEHAGERAARLTRSGPAAGVIAATQLANAAGFDRVITGDMGGTSFDVAVSVGGRPRESETTLLDFRIPVRLPMIDVRTIGAGGGSIAWVDRGGFLRVGPRSAGAIPGPACFGKGGTQPTITDCNVVLRRMDAGRRLGEDEAIVIDRDLAVEAVGALGRQLGMDAEEAAVAVLAVVNASMGAAIRLLTIEEGHDPREFALVAFGGAGPLHGGALASEAEIGTLIIPRHPGVLCGLGCAGADLRHDYSNTVERAIADDATPEIRAVLIAQEARGRAELEGTEAGIEVRHFLDMSYAGQTHTLRVAVDPEDDAAALRERFRERYFAEYGATLEPSHPLAAINARTSVIGRRPRLRADDPGPAVPSVAEPVGDRDVYFDGWCATAIYERASLLPGARLEGPAVIEQPDSTILLEPGYTAWIDGAGNLIARRDATA